jgi:hypothetical protein
MWNREASGIWSTLRGTLVGSRALMRRERWSSRLFTAGLPGALALRPFSAWWHVISCSCGGGPHPPVDQCRVLADPLEAALGLPVRVVRQRLGHRAAVAAGDQLPQPALGEREHAGALVVEPRAGHARLWKDENGGAGGEVDLLNSCSRQVRA